jgi:hypothetical protein
MPGEIKMTLASKTGTKEPNQCFLLFIVTMILPYTFSLNRFPDPEPRNLEP